MISPASNQISTRSGGSEKQEFKLEVSYRRHRPQDASTVGAPPTQQEARAADLNYPARGDREHAQPGLAKTCPPRLLVSAVCAAPAGRVEESARRSKLAVCGVYNIFLVFDGMVGSIYIYLKCY